MQMKTIIEITREAGAVDITCNGWTSWVGTQSTEFLERFAALIRADEREACAEVCEEEICNCCWDEEAGAVAEHLAATIRSRGNT